MTYIFKDGKKIATISMVSTAALEYKELFLDLNSYSTTYSREELSNIVKTVIQTGDPYKVENGQAGESLWIENGVIFYHAW